MTSHHDKGQLFGTDGRVSWVEPELPMGRHSHRPGLIWAPAFGLPGKHSSICEDCGDDIVKRSGVWVTDEP